MNIYPSFSIQSFKPFPTNGSYRNDFRANEVLFASMPLSDLDDMLTISSHDSLREILILDTIEMLIISRKRQRYLHQSPRKKAWRSSQNMRPIEKLLIQKSYLIFCWGTLGCRVSTMIVANLDFRLVMNDHSICVLIELLNQPIKLLPNILHQSLLRNFSKYSTNSERRKKLDLSLMRSWSDEW